MELLAQLKMVHLGHSLNFPHHSNSIVLTRVQYNSVFVHCILHLCAIQCTRDICQNFYPAGVLGSSAAQLICSTETWINALLCTGRSDPHEDRQPKTHQWPFCSAFIVIRCSLLTCKVWVLLQIIRSKIDSRPLWIKNTILLALSCVNILESFKCTKGDWMKSPKAPSLTDICLR